MARKRLLTLMLSAIFLLCFVGSALAAGPARRYVGSSTAKGAIYQSSYRVDAQSLTGVKSINISATLYEKGRNKAKAPLCARHPMAADALYRRHGDLYVRVGPGGRGHRIDDHFQPGCALSHVFGSTVLPAGL